MRLYLLAIVGWLYLVSPKIAYAIDCSTLDENKCNQNFPECQLLTAKSCCGEILKYCVSKDNNNCFENNKGTTCMKNGDKIYEFWSSCLPKDGWQEIPKPEPTCNMEECNKKGQRCVYRSLNSTSICGTGSDIQTSCCPRIGECEYPPTGGATVGGATVGSTNENGSCKDVHCGDGFRCVEVKLPNGYFVASCVEAGTTTGGSSSTTTGGSSSTSTTGGSSTSTTGPSTTTGSTTGSDCSNVNCPPGYHCQMENGNAICVPNHYDPCSNVTCPPHHHCVNGNCVRDPPTPIPCDPCRQVICPDGYRCLKQPEEGWNLSHRHKHWQLHPEHCNNPNKIKAICIKSPIGTCDKVRCPPGFECKLYENGPACVKKEKPKCLTCKDMHCEQNGLVCVLTPQKKKDEDCCPIIPICIKPSTIAGSTIASTIGPHYSTIASLVYSPQTSGTSGGFDSSFSSESESSDFPQGS